MDTSVYGLLPFFFGAREQRPGVLRTFTPPGNSGDAPIQMLTLDPETLGPENAPQETLALEVARNSRNASRILVDLATASGGITRRVLRMGPTVLVPLLPDMNSVVSVELHRRIFPAQCRLPGQTVLPYYVLNQFDPSLPLHLDVREVMREQLGERLLPFSLRRAPAVSEALAEGMTVVDYAPNSTVAEDFGCPRRLGQKPCCAGLPGLPRRALERAMTPTNVWQEIGAGENILTPPDSPPLHPGGGSGLLLPGRAAP